MEPSRGQRHFPLSDTTVHVYTATQKTADAVSYTELENQYGATWQMVYQKGVQGRCTLTQDHLCNAETKAEGLLRGPLHLPHYVSAKGQWSHLKN